MKGDVTLFYVFTLLILMFLGLIISIKNYNSINKTYLKLIELNNLYVTKRILYDSSFLFHPYLLIL